LVVIAAGLLSDRFGRKPLLMVACVLGFAGAVPIFWLLNQPSPLLAPAWPRSNHRPLWRHITCLFSGSGAAAGSLHGGVVGLQYLFRDDRRVNTARRDVVGRTNR